MITRIFLIFLLSLNIAKGAVSLSPGGAALNNTVFINPGANLFVASTNAPLYSEIQVASGTFTNGLSNLWFNGTWTFHGTTLRLYDIPTNTTGAGIFDDRFYGAKTCSISGALSIEYHNGTNVSVNSVDCSLGYNTNSLGALIVTNPATYIRWSADTLLGIAGQPPVPFALTVTRCQTNSYFKNLEIYNLNPANTNLITTNCPADPGTVYTIITGCAGIHWGDCFLIVNANIRPMTLQAVWGDNLSTNAGELWISGQVCDGKWYIVGRTNTWKVWAEYDEYKFTSGTIGGNIDIWNSGSHYFRGKKISAGQSTGVPIFMEIPDTGQIDTNLTVWVDIDKLSGSNAWMTVQHGQLRGRIGQFEQNGPNNNTPLINVTNISSYIALSGETMDAANIAITHGGGVSEWHGFNIRSTNKDPILVHNSGLFLDVSSIKTINGTNAIRGSSAQNVTVSRGYDGPLPDSTITLIGTNQSAYPRLGNSTSNILIGGAIFQDFAVHTNHSSASLNVTNLGTLTLPAHAITNAGDRIYFYQSGRFQNAIAATNELWLRYGSITNVIDTGFQFSSNTVYEVFATITAINATKQRVEAKLRWGFINSGVTGVPWTETNVVTFLAESNGIANTIGVYHVGQKAFGVTNETIIADWRKGYR